MRFIEFTYFPELLLRNGDELRGDAFTLVDGGMYLVQAKLQSMIDGNGNITSCTAQAVGQAIAWAELTRLVM